MRKLILAFLVATAPVFGATYYVATTGNNGAAGSEAAPWATIQYAIDNAADDDLIYVKGGNYAEAANTYLAVDDTQNLKDITVEGYTTTPGDGGETVRLTSTATAFAAYEAATCTSGSLTFKNILFTSDSVINTKTQIDHRGTGTMVFDNCTFGGTNAPSAFTSTSTASPAVTFTGCTFAASVLHEITVSSGTVGSLTIQDCAFTGPTVSGKHCVSSVGTVTTLVVDGNTFNMASAGTNAIYLPNGSNSFASVTISDNTVTLAANTAGGFILPGQLDHWRVTGNAITSTVNTASAPGVAIQVGTDGSSALETLGVGLCSDNTVTYSGTAGQHGILIGAGCSYSDVVRNVVLYTNASLVPTSACIGFVIKGNGMRMVGNYVYGPRPLLLKGAKVSLIENNTFVCIDGDCIAWYLGDAVTPTDNRIVENIIVVDGGDLLLSDYDGSSNGSDWNTVLSNNIYYTDNANFGRLGATTYATITTYSAAFATYSAWGSAEASIGTLSDPLLLSPQAGNFRLSVVSPAIGAATDGGTLGAWQPSYWRRPDRIRVR